MTTTPTFWGSEVTLTNDIFAFGPRITALADGTFILTWQSDDDIVGKHLDELGSFTAGNFLQGISSAATRPLSTPIVTQQDDGRIVVNYDLDDGSMPIDHDVIWGNVSSDYSTVTSTFGTEQSAYSEVLVDSTAHTATSTGSAGGALLLNYTGPGDATNMVLQFTDGIGNQASNKIYIDSSSTRLEQNGAMAGLHTGFVAVAYESVLQSGSFPRDIRLHVYTPDEEDASGGAVIVSATNVNAAFPDIVELADGNFVVAWQQNGGIAFRRFSGNGIAVDASPVPIASSSGGLLPKIAPLNDHGFMVAWVAGSGTETDGTPDMDIFLQRYDAGGSTVGSQIHLDKPGDQGLFSLDIATLADGRVLLTYQSETGDSTNVTTLNYQFFDPREHTITATSGNDNYVGREDGATIYGLEGDDKLAGRAAADILFGNEGKDKLFGYDGNDTLRGGEGNDILRAGRGQDIVRGGAGADSLTGGPDADTFVFGSIDDSTRALAGRDTIRDFKHGQGDIIDVHQIDARSNKNGNQDFDFIGTSNFHHQAGELRVAHQGGDTIVYADVNGDGTADFAISLDGDVNLKAADFHL